MKDIKIWDSLTHMDLITSIEAGLNIQLTMDDIMSMKDIKTIKNIVQEKLAQMELQNKVAIVTGGASGLGKAITEILLQNGTKVVVLDINQQALDNLKNRAFRYSK